jgi:hypothetical protein
MKANATTPPNPRPARRPAGRGPDRRPPPTGPRPIWARRTTPVGIAVHDGEAVAFESRQPQPVFARVVA